MNLSDAQKEASHRFEELSRTRTLNRDSFIAGYIECWKRFNSENDNMLSTIPNTNDAIDAEIEGILDNKVMLQLIQMETKYSDEEIINELEMFRLQCLAENTKHETIIDAARHFRMWINKRKGIKHNEPTKDKSSINEWKDNITDKLYQHFGM